MLLDELITAKPPAADDAMVPSPKVSIAERPRLPELCGALTLGVAPSLVLSFRLDWS